MLASVQDIVNAHFVTDIDADFPEGLGGLVYFSQEVFIIFFVSY